MTSSAENTKRPPLGGAIADADDGARAIAERWLTALEPGKRNELENLADRLLEQGAQ